MKNNKQTKPFYAIKAIALATVLNPNVLAGAMLGSLTQTALAQVAYVQATYNPDPTQKWRDWQNAGVATVRTPQLRDGNVVKLSPAQIIYYSALENRVNPVLLMAKLQHEQQLISVAYASGDLQRKLDRAAGFGVFDAEPTKTDWPGFYPQIVAASYQFGVLWKNTYSNGMDAIARYSSDPRAGQKVAEVYDSYARLMNQIAGKNYSTAPRGWGYVDDFHDVTEQHIQAFLEKFPGHLKNRSLFGGGAVVDGPKVLGQPDVPGQIKQNDVVRFSVKTDKPADAVKINFQNPSAEVTLAGSGTQWTFERPISVAGERPWTISAIVRGQVSDDHIHGVMKILSPQAAAALPKLIGDPGIPSAIDQNGLLKFSVATDRPVDRVTMVFRNPDAEVQLAGGGRAFSFDRPIGVAGERPWKLQLWSGNQSSEVAAGTLHVKPIVGALKINGNIEAPAQVNLKDPMKLRVRTSAPAARAEIDFGNNTVFPLSGDPEKTTWSWEKALTQPGKRDYQIRIYAANSSQPADQRSGSVEVLGGGGSVIHPLPDHPIARVLADPGYGYVFNSEHTGIDVMASVGTAVKAMCDGVVAGNYTGKEVVNAFLIVRHNCGGQQIYGYYGHIASSLGNGAAVQAGENLGTVRTYGSNNHHLHFGINSNLLSRGWGRSPRGTTRQAMLSAGWLDPLEYLQNKTGTTVVRTDPFLIPVGERVSREQFGLALLDSLPTTVGQKYSGVPEQRLRSAGLIQAEYRGGEAVIRGDAVRMAYRLIERHGDLVKLLMGKQQNRFDLDADLEDDTKLRQQANALAALGVVSGYQNGTIFELEPGKQLSRGEQGAIHDRLRNLLSGETVAVGPKVLGQPPIPSTIDQNAQLVFNVTTDRPADKVVMLFQNPDAEVLLAGSGTSFSFNRQISTAGARYWKIKVFSGNQVTDEHLTGTLMVRAPGNTPAPVNPSGGQGIPGNLLPWQQQSLDYAVSHLRDYGNRPMTKVAGNTCGQYTFCYAFSRSSPGIALPSGMGTAQNAFDTLLANGRTVATRDFAAVPLGAVVFFAASPANGGAGHAALKVDTENVVSQGQLGAHDCTISSRPHGKLGTMLGYYAPSTGATSVDPNVLPAHLRITRNEFVGKLSNMLGQIDASLPADPLAKAQQLGLVNNTASLNADPIIRQDAGRILERVVAWYQSKNWKIPSGIDGRFDRDPTISDDFRPTARHLAALGLFKGIQEEDGSFEFKGRGQLQRNEAELVINRLFIVLQGAGKPSTPSVALAIQAVSVSPSVVQAGQVMTFAAKLDNAQLAERIEVFFPDANRAEPMNAASDGNWTLTRPMTQAGENRSYEVRAYQKGGGVLVKQGTFTVKGAATDVARISNLSAPTQIQQNQAFVLQLQSTHSIQSAVVEFQNPLATLNMNGSGSQWTLSHLMQGAGHRPYTVRIFNGGQVVDSRGGTVNVVPVSAPEARITGLNMPVQIQQGQILQATLTTSAPASRVEVAFQSPDATVQMLGSGTQWSLNRPVEVAGSRPYTIRVYDNNGQVDDSRSGTLTVSPARPQISAVNAPGQVQQNQNFVLNVQTTLPAQGVVLDFQSPSATLNLSGNGTQWSVSHAMQVAGNRPYMVKVIQGGLIVDSRSGSVNVMPLTVQQPVADSSRPLALQGVSVPSNAKHLDKLTAQIAANQTITSAVFEFGDGKGVNANYTASSYPMNCSGSSCNVTLAPFNTSYIQGQRPWRIIARNAAGQTVMANGSLMLTR